VDGQGLAWFLFSSVDAGLYFRPMGQWFYQVDSMMWRIDPAGYHLTNLVFHILNSFWVFLLARHLTRRFAIGYAAALFFAVLPIHVGAVAWIAARYDVICAFFYFGAIFFYARARAHNDRRWYALALAMFMLALASKEIALTLPLLLVVYELGVDARDAQRVFVPAWRNYFLRWRYTIPFWLVLGFFVAVRWFIFGRIGYRGAEATPGDLVYWSDTLLARLFDPLVDEIVSQWRWIILALLVLIVIVYRRRAAMLFAFAWIPVAYLATINSGPSDRSFYIPSFGLCLALAWLIESTTGGWCWSRLWRGGAIAVLLMAYGTTTIARSQLYYRAGEVAQVITAQVREYYPSLPPRARLVFVGVPDQLPSGVLVYITGLPHALELAYRRPQIEVIKTDNFAEVSDRLDETFFFLVDHRKVYDKTEAVRAMLRQNQ
jgi:hypothetical protein